METVEAKLEVNVAKSVDTTFSQETGDRFVRQRLYLNLVWPSCDLFMPFDIRYSDKQRKKRFPNHFQFFQNEELRRKIKIRKVLA